MSRRKATNDFQRAGRYRLSSSVSGKFSRIRSPRGIPYRRTSPWIEIIEDLASHKVKYVVMDPKSIYFRIDNIANNLRAPLVFNYVRAHYRQHRDIEGQLVLIRNAETN